MTETKDCVVIIEKLIDKMLKWTSDESSIMMNLATLLNVEFSEGELSWTLIVDPQGETVIIEADPASGDDSIRITIGYEEMTLKLFEDLLKAIMAAVFHWNYLKKRQVSDLLKTYDYGRTK